MQLQKEQTEERSQQINTQTQQRAPHHTQMFSNGLGSRSDCLSTLGDGFLNSLASCESTPALTPMLTPVVAHNILNDADLGFSLDSDANFLGSSVFPPLTDMLSMHLPTSEFYSLPEALSLGLQESKRREDVFDAQGSINKRAKNSEINEAGGVLTDLPAVSTDQANSEPPTIDCQLNTITNANARTLPTEVLTERVHATGATEFTLPQASLTEYQNGAVGSRDSHSTSTGPGTTGLQNSNTNVKALGNSESTVDLVHRGASNESVFRAPTTGGSFTEFGGPLTGLGQHPVHKDHFAVPTSVFGAMLPSPTIVPMQGFALPSAHHTAPAPLLQRRQSVPAPTLIQPALPVTSTYSSGSRSNQTTPQLAPTPFTTPVLPSTIWGATSPVVPPLQLPEVKSNYQAIQEGEGSSRGFADDVLKVGHRRIHHKTSEKKRRETINMLFAQAAALIPVLTQQRAKGVSHSKTVILQHVVDHLSARTHSDAQITQLTDRNKALEQENTQLKRKLADMERSNT